MTIEFQNNKIILITSQRIVFFHGDGNAYVMTFGISDP